MESPRRRGTGGISAALRLSRRVPAAGGGTGGSVTAHPVDTGRQVVPPHITRRAVRHPRTAAPVRGGKAGGRPARGSGGARSPLRLLPRLRGATRDGIDGAPPG